MKIRSILFQEQADDKPHEETTDVAVNYNIDNKQDEELSLQLLDYLNLLGVLLTMTCGVIAVFNLSKGFLCATVVFLVCTVYTIFFRLNKLKQFRKKWCTPKNIEILTSNENKSPMEKMKNSFLDLGKSMKL